MSLQGPCIPPPALRAPPGTAAQRRYPRWPAESAPATDLGIPGGRSLTGHQSWKAAGPGVSMKSTRACPLGATEQRSEERRPHDLGTPQGSMHPFLLLPGQAFVWSMLPSFCPQVVTLKSLPGDVTGPPNLPWRSSSRPGVC